MTTTYRSGLWLCGLALAGLLLTACADDNAAAGALGVEGASCLRSPDCQSPLQCLKNLCTPWISGGPSDASGDAAEAGALDSEAGTSDLLHVTEIPVDAELPGDLPFVDKDPGPNPLDTGQAEVFSDCENLGISDRWDGAFTGAIVFDISTMGLVPPELEKGTITVLGDLGFRIICIDSKLLVQGQMSGSGSVLGDAEQGDFPFEVTISGFYSPSNQALNADMVEGVVTIYGLVEAYFTGTLEGRLKSGQLIGTWKGATTGTNLPTVITGDAEGKGAWAADPGI
ncbi:MAG: hypothetical protein R3F39_09205 [Myxococcota bacterium]